MTEITDGLYPEVRTLSEGFSGDPTGQDSGRRGFNRTGQTGQTGQTGHIVVRVDWCLDACNMYEGLMYDVLG